MIKLVASVCIEAPHDVVWARLAKLEDIQLWSKAIVHTSCTGPLAQGVGAGKPQSASVLPRHPARGDIAGSDNAIPAAQ
jgi:hypothetical protein